MDRLNKKDLIDFVSEEAHLTKAEAKEIVDSVFQHMEDTLVAGKEVNISNFGVLAPLTRKTRIGTDPKKHTKITIERTKTVSFRPSKQLKGRLND